MGKKFLGKTIKELTLIGAVVLLFLTYTPTVYNGAEKVFNWGIKYNEVYGSIKTLKEKNTDQDLKISSIERSVNSWRAVWCISELSKKSQIPQAVSNACQEWIRNQ